MLDHAADVDALDSTDVRADRPPLPLRNVLRADVAAPRSTATRCSPRRPRSRTAASGSRASSARRRERRASRSPARCAPATRRRVDVVEEHLAPSTEREAELHAFNL